MISASLSVNRPPNKYGTWFLSLFVGYNDSGDVSSFRLLALAAIRTDFLEPGVLVFSRNGVLVDLDFKFFRCLGVAAAVVALSLAIS